MVVLAHALILPLALDSSYRLLIAALPGTVYDAEAVRTNGAVLLYVHLFPTIDQPLLYRWYALFLFDTLLDS